MMMFKATSGSIDIQDCRAVAHASLFQSSQYKYTSEAENDHELLTSVMMLKAMSEAVALYQCREEAIQMSM